MSHLLAVHCATPQLPAPGSATLLRPAHAQRPPASAAVPRPNPLRLLRLSFSAWVSKYSDRSITELEILHAFLRDHEDGKPLPPATTDCTCAYLREKR